MLTIQKRLKALNQLERAMGDSTRSKILPRLLEGPGYPGELARDLNLARTNASNHLACLRGCGPIVTNPEGRQTRYEIVDPHLTRALGELVNVVRAVDEGSPCQNDTCLAPGCCDTRGQPPGRENHGGDDSDQDAWSVNMECQQAQMEPSSRRRWTPNTERKRSRAPS